MPEHGITRRAAAAAPVLLVAAAPAAEAQARTPAFTITLQTAAASNFAGVSGARRFTPITGGAVEGARLKGVVVNGAEWVAVRADGVEEVSARFTVKAADGAILGVALSGLRTGQAAQLTAMIDAGPGPHRWLSDAIITGASTGARIAFFA